MEAEKVLKRLILQSEKSGAGSGNEVRFLYLLRLNSQI